MAYQNLMPQYGAGGAMQQPYSPPVALGTGSGGGQNPYAPRVQAPPAPRPTAPPGGTGVPIPMYPGSQPGFDWGSYWGQANTSGWPTGLGGTNPTQDQWNTAWGGMPGYQTPGTSTPTPTPNPNPTPTPNPLLPPPPNYPAPSTFNPTELGQTLGSRLQHFLSNPAPYFNESLFTGMGGQTQQGLQQQMGVADMANQTGGFRNAWDFAGDLTRLGGLTNAQGGQMGQMGGMTGQWGNLAQMLGRPGQTEGTLGGIQGSLAGPSYAESGFRNMAGGAGSPSMTEQTMMGVARGDNLNQVDPAYQQMVDRLAGGMTADITAGAGMSGRQGSNLLADSIGENVGGMRLQAANDYRMNEQARQQQALGAIEGQRQQGFGNQMGALGAADSARMGQLNSRLGTLGMMQGAGDNRMSQLMAALGGQQGTVESQFGMGQTGVGNALTAGGQMGNLYNQFLMPGQTYQDAGGAYDANSQGQQMGNYDLFNRGHDADYNRMQEILGSFTNSQGNTGMQEEIPWWQQILGYVAGNAGQAARVMTGMGF